MSKVQKFFLFLVLFSAGLLYSYLAFIHVVPSVFHTSFIRKLWDKNYAYCVKHQLQQASLASSRQTLYLTISPRGRLANRMFQFASLIGIARKNYRIPFLEPDHLLTSFFPLDVQTLSRSRSPVCMDSIQDRLPCTFDEKMEHLPTTNLSLDGYMQSWKYFKGYEKEIRNQFNFKDFINQDADGILHRYLSERKATELYIGVHVRRTDMMIPSSTRLGFKAAPLDYILNAMKYMRQKFNNSSITFVTVSDDHLWCKYFLHFPDVVIIPTNMEEVDLAILTKCNHSIITTGTYGWWGAWLAGGHTVYYSNFPEKGSKLDREMNKADFYPPDWVAVDRTSFIRFEKLVLILIIFMGITVRIVLLQ